MYSKIKKIWKEKWIFRSIISSIFFNFYYLPIKQAVKLPIILYKPQFIKLKGKVIIQSPEIKTGMIKLGKRIVPIYPNSGIIFENNGGTIIFEGSCAIGNNSALSIGKYGNLTIGDNFIASTTLKLVCLHQITIGERSRIGWECTLMDTDFHKLTKLNGKYTKGYGCIKIGKNNWLGTKCHVLKNTETPDYCIVSATTLLNKKVEFPSYSIIGGNPINLLASGIFRNVDDDKIDCI